MASGMTAGLFVTCLADSVFPRAAIATVHLLERLGVQVEFPAAQTCCGQMHINTGYREQALPLMRHQIDTFAGYDVVVAPSASCVSSVRHQYVTLARAVDDDALAAAASDLASRTFELSEFLVRKLELTDVGAYYPHRVTFHPTCHSLRSLRSDEHALTLLRSVRGLTLLPLPDADQCCGFGGTFALKNADVSTAMLADKMQHVMSTGAEVVTAADASCLLHIGGGLSRLRAGTRVAHLAEILEAGSREPA
jgi:L-lactate dehydrogenase complex protein LldE